MWVIKLIIYYYYYYEGFIFLVNDVLLFFGDSLWMLGPTRLEKPFMKHDINDSLGPNTYKL